MNCYRNGLNYSKLLQREGNVERFEMYRTFNCGVGIMVITAVDASEAG